MPTNSEKDRRNYSRITFDAPAKLTLPSGETIETAIHDLSLKGIMLEIDTGNKLENGAYRLLLTLSDDICIEMDISLSHQEVKYAGFICDYIDVDSMTHLRRLVELNMGDVTLLDREFHQLGSQAKK